ncbi:MAG: hypothetical protein QOJ39_1520 [Candidatus Eremiobacteraeota bacterium]|jgi:antitoxin component of RelBE/YafQ-DinJ toxin-antitoxin module|nr:hypothetical protein [Candidatus Eremiobacteraeota bacterium]
MTLSPERQLAAFLSKYAPDMVAEAEAVLATIRARLPGAARVRALMTEAIARSAKPFDDTQPNRIVIRAVAAKQRPRRPAARSKKGAR